LSGSTTNSVKDEIRVLLVDDESAQLELAKLNLEKADASLFIDTVSTPKEALTLLREQPYECVISDYQMPGTDGVQLCREIRAFSSTPFIIYTGRSNDEIVSTAFSAGADDYISKEKELSHYQIMARRIRQTVEKRRFESLYRISVDDNRDGFAIIRGLDCVYANKAMAEMLGVQRPEDLVGKSILTWVADIDRDPVWDRTLSRQRIEVQPRVYEYRVKRADGEIRTLEASASIINYMGKPASLVFNRDITERKKAEKELKSLNDELVAINEKLRTSQEEIMYYSNSLEERVDERTREISVVKERLQAFMDSSSEGFSLYDEHLNIIEANRVVLSHFRGRTTKEDVIGKNITELYPGIEDTEWFRAYRKVLETGEPYYADAQPGVASMSNMFLSASAFKVSSGLGVVSRDVSRRVMADKRLRHAEQMAVVSRMGATVAHDLRGPLGAIVQAVNMFKNDPSLSPKMLQIIEESAVRSLKMISNWRSSTREIEPVLVKTDLGALVRRVLEGTTIPSNVEVVTLLDDGLDSVSIDSDIMHRVIDNLVRNAIEAMPSGGKLSISAEMDHGGVSLKVSDTGLGIPEEASKKIFSPLYTTKAGGMGLGLAFCHKAVEAHGGSISFQSKVGEGTTFTVKLPVK
jgi:PAS domain S-box-containing protein